MCLICVHPQYISIIGSTIGCQYNLQANFFRSQGKVRKKSGIYLSLFGGNPEYSIAYNRNISSEESHDICSTVTDVCTISNGVKLGGVLSPILFTSYVDELLTRLRDAHLGCHIGSLFCGVLGYADDVVILAPTLYSLMVMLDIK